MPKPSHSFLFVKLKHIGDSLILTPTLTAVREAYPDARIDVLLRAGCQGIMAGCPAIDNIYLSAAPEIKNRSRSQALHQLKQIMHFRKVGYDCAFDMTSGDRSRLIVGLSGAKKRVSNSFFHKVPAHLKWLLNDISSHDYEGHHQVLHDYQLAGNHLKLPATPPPLTFAKPEDNGPEAYKTLDNFAVIHTATRWKRKEWPADRWIQVGQYLLEKFDHILVSVGPSEGEITFGDQIAQALGPKVINTRGDMNFSELAALLYRCKLFVGVDTAVMHLAAACQTPMVTLFGPTDERLWCPWGNENATVVFDKDKETKAYRDGPYNPILLDINAITIDSVIKACDDVLARAKQP